MNKEYEMIEHPQINDLKVFLVNLHSRAPHSHKELEIGFILKGSIRLMTDNATHSVSSGDMYLLNPMELHEITAQEDETIILAIQMSAKLLSPYLLSLENTWFYSGSIRCFFSHQEQKYEVLKGLCVELAYSYFSRLNNYELKCMSILSMIFYTFHTYIPQKKFTDAELAANIMRDNRLNRLTDYIEQHFRSKLLLHELAKRENLTLTYLSHFFKDNMNLTFQEYLNLKRFDYACNLLQNTEKNILTISLESGFSDIRFLNKLCLKYYRCTPKEFRRQHQKSTGRTISVNTQNIFAPSDSIKILDQICQQYHHDLCNYSIWEFYC